MLYDSCEIASCFFRAQHDPFKNIFPCFCFNTLPIETIKWNWFMSIKRKFFKFERKKSNPPAPNIVNSTGGDLNFFNIRRKFFSYFFKGNFVKSYFRRQKKYLLRKEGEDGKLRGFWRAEQNFQVVEKRFLQIHLIKFSLEKTIKD